MSKYINADRRLKLMPPAESGVRVVVVSATSGTTDRAEEKPMIDKPSDRLALEATIEALREQRAQMKTLTDACADMGHATAELVRRAAAAQFPQAAPKAPKPPPPVSTHLRRFASAIAEKVVATTALLTDQQRARLGALVPAFTCAALGNEPDVVAMVVHWMDLPPEAIARDMITNLDAFERRFAS